MNPITVTVVSAGPGRFLSLRWRDPKTGRLKHQSSKTRDPQAASLAASKLSSDLERQYGSKINAKWAEFRDAFAKEAESSLAEKSVEHWNTVANSIDRCLKLSVLSDLDAEKISTWQQTLRDEEKSEGTVEGYSGTLRAALSWGVDRGWLEFIPRMLKRKSRAPTIPSRLDAIEKKLQELIDLLK